MNTLGRWLRWIVALLAVASGVAWAQQAPPGAGADALALGKPLQNADQKAAIIRLNGEVNDVMLKSLHRRLDLARKAGCTLIVFEIDTYGGIVQYALDITKVIKRLPDEHLNTVAWINNKALSAGALIAASCQQVVMTKDGSIGACAPIAVNMWGTPVPLDEEERRKFSSPVIADFDDSATKNHYNRALLDAMVVSAIEMHEMQNTITGETRYVDSPGKDQLLKEEVDGPGGQKQRPWTYIQTVDNKDQLLTIGSGDLALKMGLSKATIDTEDQLRGPMRIQGDILVLDFNWAELATVFLTQLWVRGILFVGMLVFAWIEFSHPGVSVPGILAVVCLILLVGAPFLTGLAQIWEIALIVVGLGIIVADFFAFGGIGLLAIPGFILMAIGLIASFIPADPGGGFPSTAATWTALRNGMVVVVGGSFIALFAFFLLSRYLYLTPGFNRLQLAPAGGRNPAPSAVVRDATDRSADEAVFLGALGLAATDLRPAGKGRFGDHLVDIVSYGSFIACGTTVLVIEIAGPRVVVKPAPPPATENPPAAPADPSSMNPTPGGGGGGGIT